MLLWELAIVVCLILLNGVFAMSEPAVVSSRRTRLQQMAASGSAGARAALKLLDDPTVFLSTVQIGITLIGILAGAYSGATLAEPLAAWLSGLPILAGHAYTAALTLVVVCITYLSLVAGELVPKRIALSRAETIASLVARPMSMLARAGGLLVWLLRISTESVLKIFGVPRMAASTVTEEEVKALIREGTEAGVFQTAERDMIDGVLRLAERPARWIMTPRVDMVWISPDDDPQTIRSKLAASGHSRFPVGRGGRDDFDGVVRAKDLLERVLGGGLPTCSHAFGSRWSFTNGRRCFSFWRCSGPIPPTWRSWWTSTGASRAW